MASSWDHEKARENVRGSSSIVVCVCLLSDMYVIGDDIESNRELKLSFRVPDPEIMRASSRESGNEARILSNSPFASPHSSETILRFSR